MFWRKKKKPSELNFSIEVTVEDDNQSGLAISSPKIVLIEQNKAFESKTDKLNITPSGLKPVSELIKEVAINESSEFIKIKSPQTLKNIRKIMFKAVTEGWDQSQIISQINSIITDEKLAEETAQTETVFVYQKAEYLYALSSQALGKEWDYNGPYKHYNRKLKKYEIEKPDICYKNASVSAIPLKNNFPSGHQIPPVHPNCKCGVRYIYRDEWDKLGLNTN